MWFELQKERNWFKQITSDVHFNKKKLIIKQASPFWSWWIQSTILLITIISLYSWKNSNFDNSTFPNDLESDIATADSQVENQEKSDMHVNNPSRSQLVVVLLIPYVYLKKEVNHLHQWILFLWGSYLIGCNNYKW